MRGKKCNPVNDNYFDVLTTENCQWGGYIAADGYIRRKQTIRLACKLADRIILDQAKKDINFYNPIRPTTAKLIGGKIHYGVETAFTSKQINENLIKHFNIGPRKSLTLTGPNLNESDHKLAYMVGLINGDGSIYRDSSRNAIYLSITGTLAICEWCRNLYNEHYPLNYSYIHKNGSIFSFKIGNPTTKMFLTKLLQLNCFHLERKWSIVLTPDITKQGRSRK